MIGMDNTNVQLDSDSTDIKEDVDNVADDMGCCKSRSGGCVESEKEGIDPMNNGGNVDVDSERRVEQIQQSSNCLDDTVKEAVSSEGVQVSLVVNESEDDRQNALESLRNVRTNDDYEDDMDAASKYEYFWKSESIYSQWHSSVFYVNGTKFSCAEQYMMYRKAKLFNDDETAKVILKTSSPRRIKQLGREVRGFVDAIWKYHCFDIVKDGNIAKFSSTKLKEEIFSTHPKILVEASPFDKVWGIGLEEHDPSAWDESKWQGTNYLGFILTEVRNDLMIKEGRLTETDRKNFVEKEKDKYLKPYQSVLEVLQIPQETLQKENQESNQKNSKTSKNHNDKQISPKFKETNSEDYKKEKKSNEHKNKHAFSKSLNQDVENEIKPDKGATFCNSNEKRQLADIHLSKEEAEKDWKVVSSKKAKNNQQTDSIPTNQERPQSEISNKKKKKKKRGHAKDSSMSCAESSSISSNEVKAEKYDKIKESEDFEPHVPNSSASDRKQAVEKHQGSGVNHTDQGASSSSPSEKELKDQEHPKLSRRQKKNARKTQKN